MANHEFMEKITLVSGVSGFEKRATRVMKEYLEDCVDEFQYDNLGSLVAVKKGTGDLKVLMAGHIDEIGFVVKGIEKDGYIKVHPLGGWPGRNLPSSVMILTTREGKEIKGVFGGSPKGGEAGRQAPLPVDALLDIGVTSKEEAVAAGVRIGDPICPASEFTVMTNPKFLMSKAWDDRVGVVVISEVMKALKGVETEATIYAAGTIQEEVGCRGAKTVGQMVQPDVAFALDVCFSNDVPDGKKDDVKLGCGVVLGVLDGSVIAHTGLLKKMESLCEELGLDYQLDVLQGGGTDSGELSKVGKGVVNMTLSIPSRYMHSSHTIVCEDDIDATVKVLTEFCKRITPAMLEEIKKDKQ